jgi:hypothetical protein
MMKLVEEIRIENLELLVAEAGTADALAERAKLSPVYISQIRTRAIDMKTGRPRNLGTTAARKLEIGMQKSRGWMDVSHHNDDEPTSTSPTDHGITQWPFRASYDAYLALPQSKKEQLDIHVSAFIEGAAPIKSHAANKQAA